MTPLLWVDQQPPAPYEILLIKLTWVLCASNDVADRLVVDQDCYLVTLKPLLRDCWVSRGVIWQASPVGLKRFHSLKALMLAAWFKAILRIRGCYRRFIGDETIFLSSVSGEFARKMLNVFWSWFLTKSLHACGTSSLYSFFAIRDVFSNFITGRMITFLDSYSQLKGFTCYCCNCVKLTINVICWMCKDSSSIRPKDLKRDYFDPTMPQTGTFKNQTCDEKKQNHLFSDFDGQILFDWNCNLR